MKRRDLFFAVLVLIIVWQVAAMVVQRPILPSPIEVSKIFVTDLENGQLAQHFLASLWRVLASTFLAIALAAPLGLLLGQSKRFNNIFSPMMYLLYPIPKVVFVPIVLHFF